ncbi:MAG: hypothetical protein Q9181_006444 [Wetmoreana brouardii]
MFTFADGETTVAVRLPPYESETRQPQPITLFKATSTLRTPEPTSFVSMTDLDPPDIKVNLPRYPSSVLRTQERGANAMLKPPATSSPARARPLGPIARREDDWRAWIELRLRVVGVPADITTGELWACFTRHGQVAQIEIMEDSRGTRDGVAKVTYNPPPPHPFWQIQPFFVNLCHGPRASLRLFLEPPRRTFYHLSPVDPMVKYPEVMTLPADSIDFGFMYDPRTMMAMHTINDGGRAGLRYKQSMLHRETIVEFRLDVNGRPELFRFSIPFAHLEVIHRVNTNSDITIELLVSLPTPPRFFRKLEERDTHDAKARYWAENDAWYRQTDITHTPADLKSSPVALKKPSPIIDIGRWTTYRLVFKKSPEKDGLFSLIGQALRDYNISIKELTDFRIASHREPAVWKYIDKPIVALHSLGGTLEELLKEETVPLLPFAVRYQLEVCISYGYLNEHNLSQAFVEKLKDIEPAKAQDILEYVANQEKRIFDTMDLFNLKIIKGSASRPPIPHYCAYVRSATVTPSTIYFNSPTVEISNRVIRHYAEHADRFLRVRFTDEKGKIYSTEKDTMDEVFTRVKRTLRNGITIGDRHYEFLAFGNSQFRENGAYFFAPTHHLHPRHIRNWMGDFDEIPYVAQYAARLGQCFSTTRAIIGTKPKDEEVEDVERNGYIFTDGVAKISPFLAQFIMSELGVARSSAELPSVFQFRYGGCKGILTISPDLTRQEITIRRSQYKFAARTETLEIIRWSQFAAANLNRQIIVVLSTLGVPDGVFLEKQKAQLANLEPAMNNEQIALAMLQKDIDPNQMTLTVAGMILDGFQKFQEPFMMSILRLWRAWCIKYLKEKARITIEKGAFVFGCVDETATLRGHFNDTPVPKPDEDYDDRVKKLPEVFIQLSKGYDNKPSVILGPMLLARNPSLHPGDIRVVRGVDVQALRHLKDVVVVPQTGDRPIVNMCSGGDLDGDDYLVIWDLELLPREWNHPPMDFTPAQKIALGRPITPDDLTSFFVTYMKNDNLSKIAVAHLALADFMEDGVKSTKCLKLAELHSTAVDYTKSGVPARMTRDLAPPKWPHFMEKANKPKDNIYHSRKVLGQLFDQVERVDFIPVFRAPFDMRILRAYNIEPKMLKDAAVLKRQYEAAMRRIMAQHAIKTEFEVWSTFVMSHSKASNDYKFHEEIGRISKALKDGFRAQCCKVAGATNPDDIKAMGPFVVAMYTVTANEIEEAVERAKAKDAGGEGGFRWEKMPMMSFPWLFQGMLGRIANRTLIEFEL